jgi:chromosomal replication initiator protein
MTVLDTMYPRRSRRVLSVGQIQATVASHYKIAVSDLVSGSRAARISWPRQVAIYLARELTGTPLQTIGEAFGGRNHATVLHACKRVSDRVAADHEAGIELDDLKTTLAAGQDDRSC